MVDEYTISTIKDSSNAIKNLFSIGLFNGVVTAWVERMTA
jgi:hypothetical protein